MWSLPKAGTPSLFHSHAPTVGPMRFDVVLLYIMICLCYIISLYYYHHYYYYYYHYYLCSICYSYWGPTATHAAEKAGAFAGKQTTSKSRPGRDLDGV